MSPQISEMKIPLVIGDNDILMIEGTRIPLDTVIYLYREGATAEEMVERFPTLNLADTYLLIAHYLRNKEELDTYLLKREAFRKALRKEVESHSDRKGIRERLLARRTQSI
jgi:uncharacterized protein (DUF433 family)